MAGPLNVAELAMVPYIEGRVTPDPADPNWPLYREAVEIVTEQRDRRAHKQIRQMLSSGAVSKWELLRAGVR